MNKTEDKKDVEIDEFKSKLVRTHFERNVGTIKITKKEIFDMLVLDLTFVKIAEMITEDLAGRAEYYRIYKEKIAKELVKLMDEGFKATNNLYDSEKEQLEFVSLKLFKYINNLGK